MLAAASMSRRCSTDRGESLLVSRLARRSSHDAVMSSAIRKISKSDTHLIYSLVTEDEPSYKRESNVLRQLHERRKKSYRPKRERGARVRINVSGSIFDTYHTTLICKRGSIFNLENIWNYFDRGRKEFFFDRDARSFEAIFTYMQCGLLIKPEKVPYKVFIEDLQFYGFEELAFKLYKEEVQILQRETYNPEDVKNLRDRLWYMLRFPYATIPFRLLDIFSSTIVLVSTILICLESLPSFKGRRDIIQNVEIFCVTWFTIETLTKFLVCYEKVRFFTNSVHVLDVASILPFYVYKLTTAEHVFKGSLLRVFRLARVIDSLGLPHCSQMLRIVVNAIKTCIKETLVLISVFLIVAVLFATIIYSVEHNPVDPRSGFDSIPSIMWLCIVTMTTVGYGDMTPESAAGKAVCSIIVAASILVISLPLPIIIGNFLRNYMKIKEDITVNDYQFDDDKSFVVQRENFKRR